MLCQVRGMKGFFLLRVWDVEDEHGKNFVSRSRRALILRAFRLAVFAAHPENFSPMSLKSISNLEEFLGGPAQKKKARNDNNHQLA